MSLAQKAGIVMATSEHGSMNGATADAVEHGERFAVRQVLYLIPKDGGPSITPVQVTEEIRRTTLSGTNITYAVKGASSSDDPSFVLDDEHEVFPTVAALRAELLRRATEALDSMVNAAVMQATTAFSGTHAGLDEIVDHADDDALAGTVGVQLPDGHRVRARIKGL